MFPRLKRQWKSVNCHTRWRSVSSVLRRVVARSDKHDHSEIASHVGKKSMIVMCHFGGGKKDGDKRNPRIDSADFQ